MTLGNQNGLSFGNAGVPNTSGRGPETVVPPEVACKFNWGAFLLSWIWGLGNKTYIALIILALSFIPFIGGIASLAFSIWLGIKGNELAWQNKQFTSIEEFHEYQKKWAMWGAIITGACFALAVLGIVAAFVFGGAAQ